MNNDKKVYSIIGKVEIGTDEYRDLIEAVAEANERANNSSRDYWKKYNECRELEAKVKELEARLEEFSAIINSDESFPVQMKLYKMLNCNRKTEV